MAHREPSGMICNEHGVLPEPFAVPRRYGVGSMLVVTTAFAVVYGILRWAGAGARVMVFFTVVLAGAALAQMVLRKRPRLASIVVGSVQLPLWTALYPEHSSIAARICACVGAAMAGALLGYVTGTLVSGLFLVTHLAAQWVRNK